MSNLVCKDCGKAWHESQSYKTGKGRLRHYCQCGSRLAPIEVSGGSNSARSVKKEVPRVKKREVQGTRTLVIPDLHAPFMHPDAVGFLKRIYKKYRCDSVVILGDELDNHYSSFHETDPDGLSAKEELKRAATQLIAVAEAFPVAKVCIGNHTAIPQRKVFNAGLSNRWVKTVKDVLLELGVPCKQWDYSTKHVLNGVTYTHGTGRKAKQRMMQDGISTAQGHYHGESYIWYHVNAVQKIFALQVGALIDDDAYAFAYAKYFAKSHKNCAVVIEGVPILEYMDLGSKVNRE